MTSLSLRHDRGGQVALVFVEPGHMLVIPVNAAGAEALFDAFTTLPGLGAARILAARQSPYEGTRTLWRRADVPALTQ